MAPVDSRSRIRFCIPMNRSPYIEIDGIKYHIGERPKNNSKLATVLGHLGKEFTQRDFALLLFLAMEAKKLGVPGIEMSCERIAGTRGWHRDRRQVRTGVAKRFDGTVHAHKNSVVWDPMVPCEFDDEQRCRQYLGEPMSAATEGDAPAKDAPARDALTRSRDATEDAETGTSVSQPETTPNVTGRLDDIDLRMKNIEAALTEILAAMAR